jgi:hypothetical protein
MCLAFRALDMMPDEKGQSVGSKITSGNPDICTRSSPRILAESRKYETSKAADRKFRGFFLHKYFLEWFSKLTSCCPATPISSSVPAATWCLGRLWEHSKRYRRNG